MSKQKRTRIATMGGRARWRGFTAEERRKMTEIARNAYARKIAAA